MTKDLTGNTVAQIHLAEALTVLCVMRTYNIYENSSISYSGNPCGSTGFYQIYVDISNKTTRIPILNNQDVNWGQDINYENLSESAIPEQEKIDAVAHIKMQFADLN